MFGSLDLPRQQQGSVESASSNFKATAVITSPPYPNRFSYAREFRPDLFSFDFIEDAQAVGQLRLCHRWHCGKASSVLAARVSPPTH